MKINWKQKLSSRKFWASVAMMVSGVVLMATSDENTAQLAGGLVAEFGGVIVYLICETATDIARIKWGSVGAPDNE